MYRPRSREESRRRVAGVSAPSETRVAVVTGCASGIGRATARAFAAAGWLTVATARRLEQLDELRDAGCDVEILDVTNGDDRERVIASTLAKYGRIDALVNNAGYPEYGALEEVTIERWRAQFETNVFGVVALTQLVVPSMRERHWGRIINISSMGGVITLPLGAAYHASKFAVEALSDVARFELAPFGIDVVIIEPGVVLSNYITPAQAGLNLSDDSPYYALSTAFALVLAKTYGKKTLTNVTPARIARTIVKAASVKRPRTRYALPLQAKVLMAARRLSPDRVYDAIQRSQIR